ncbi:MAG: tRNA (N6-threonylcarbamoyladenosine(37)-N6)-methyltransferase TrmO [Myxococcales bacterium]|nr:tRNA (N6-threonylcarbamoyladenosine(37)-N6)-methyltransferase TrmO [Polyangiaceae bacterium]MDW8251652.1 tRNA (N6-threonylcarbamoyladenosine(37)-N6)-methyltransferase TrmO [Myxococcales bacterium]
MKLWTFEPIGILRTPFREWLSAPRQPAEAAEVTGEIELFSAKNYEHALEDIGVWSHLWVIFVFDRNKGWKPKVWSPQSECRRGVLATRAPYRPNPLELSVMQLESVEGLRLRVRGVDMLDGSPVLDRKPYVPYTDVVTEASGGWLGGEADPGPRYEVSWGEAAKEQEHFLSGLWVALKEAVEAVLAVSPHPHPYRRIRLEAGGQRRLALREWRVWFSVEGARVRVERLGSGHRPAERGAPRRDVHQAFAERFG